MGKYINGKWNGLGREYYDNDKIKYIGEFSDGKWNGKGKEYYPNGKIKYIGQFFNGNRIIKEKKIVNYDV